VLHRAVVSSSRARFSIPTFYCPSPDAVITPAAALTDAEHPAVYKSFKYEEYYEEFWNKELRGATCLQSFSRNYEKQPAEKTDNFPREVNEYQLEHTQLIMDKLGEYAVGGPHVHETLP